MTDNDDEILLQCADCKGLIMPIIVKDVDNGRGVIFEGSGVLNTWEYVEALKKHLTQDPQIYKEFRYCLADYTGVTKTDLNFELMWGIIKLAEKAYTVNPNMVVASVADSDAHYGVARMSESLIEHVGWEFRVFRKREEAEAWLRAVVKDKYGIDDPILE